VQIERPPEPDTPGYRRLLWTTVTVNVIVEELYFRAFLMGEMEFLEGGAWAVNGVLFTLYHVFQRWMWPGILPGALFGAGFFQWRGSIYPLMLGHFVGNALGLLSARQAGQRARDALPTP
jgi:membrane protease YdiL (CAAX protease family)